MLFPKETRWGHDQCSLRRSIINATWNVSFSTSTVDCFPFKRTSIPPPSLPPKHSVGVVCVFQLYFQCSIHLESLKPTALPQYMTWNKGNMSMVLLDQTPSKTTCEEAYWELFPISNSCLLTDPKFRGLPRALSLKYGRQ